MASPPGSAAQAAWSAVQKRFVEQLPQLILVVAKYVEADSFRLHSYAPSPLGLFTGVERATVSTS